MNPTDRDSHNQAEPGDPSLEREQNMGEEQQDLDAELQKEGNLGNERNRNEPDTEQRPGGSRNDMDL